MARFCTQCGRPLQDGEVCHCTEKQRKPEQTVVNKMSEFKDRAVSGSFSSKSFLETIKNHMGIGNPELNKGDAFERGKQIIPDCVKSNESEISIRQYHIATLKKRILGIPYAKAVGRLQVTNQRVIFRAPGRSIAGRTTLQHEFSINEVAGLEARREHTFALWALLAGVILIAVGAAVSSALLTMMLALEIHSGDMLLTGKVGFGTLFFAFLIGAAGCIPFFLLKKKWPIKLLCLGVSIQIFNGIQMIGSGFFLVLFLIVLVLTLFTLIVYCIRPNLVLLIKTKSTSLAVDIQKGHTGFNEILPEDDAEKCIREISAMISDIQKLGDFGIEKWRVKESDEMEGKRTV